MRVLLIRHAHAVESDSLTDDVRWLSVHGRKVARAVGLRLRDEGFIFDAVVSSPLVRAVQTAELIAIGAGYTGEVLATPALAPGFSARIGSTAIEGLGESVVVVGHEPSISQLAGFLVGVTPGGALKKGQVVIIEDGRIAGSIDPDTLV
jgi:phosphohistidine phosphatase